MKLPRSFYAAMRMQVCQPLFNRSTLEKGQLPRRASPVPRKSRKANIVKKPYFRRPWLCLAAGILALHSGPNGAQATDQVGARTAAEAFDATVRESSFDLGWRFYRGSLSGAEAPEFDDSGWRQLDVPHDWRIEDLPYATSDDGGATANPSWFAFNTKPSHDGNPPPVIGPFDANADPIPDADFTVPGLGHFVSPGGRNQGYTVAGVGWYRKHFRVPHLRQDEDHRDREGEGQHVELRFDGDYPKDLYDDRKFDQDHAWMVGSWVWSGWDYIGESAIGAPAAAATEAQANAFGIGAAAGQVPYPWCVSFSGDLDLIGQRKPQNYWRAVMNGFSPLEVMVERPTPLGTQQFAVWFCYYDELPSWTWAVPQGQTMTVHVYTSGDSVTLRLNGMPVATKTLTEADKRVAAFSVPYTPGELTAIANLNGREIARKTLTTVGAPAAIRLSFDVKWLTTDRGDLAHVLAEVVDSYGRVVPDAVVKVNFQVGGAGELIGVGNGNPHNVDSFKRPRHYTWHGRPLAILRPAKWPGSLMLTATADGLQPCTLTLGVAPGRGSLVNQR